MALHRRQQAEEHRADLRAGVIASAVLNPWRGEGEDALTPHDFFPWLPEPEEKELTTPEEIKAWIDEQIRPARRRQLN